MSLEMGTKRVFQPVLSVINQREKSEKEQSHLIVHNLSFKADILKIIEQIL